MNLPSDVAACEVRGGPVLEAQGEGAVSCARPPGVVKMEAQGDKLGLHSTEVVVTLRQAMERVQGMDGSFKALL